MAIIDAAQSKIKTVADPNAQYESMVQNWVKNRAVCKGERAVKEYDSFLDTTDFQNLLIPFSPSMSIQQYEFYKSEAELPGITASFAKMIVGGLLRKQPVVTLPEELGDDVHDWIVNAIAKDGSPLSAFLDEALWEEIQTSRAWILVDHPVVPENITPEDQVMYAPYPKLIQAESIINWRIKDDGFGQTILDRLIIRGLVERYEENEFHPTFHDTVWVHELNESGNYQIRVYEKEEERVQVEVSSGDIDKKPKKFVFKHKETISDITKFGQPLPFIPAWPLNGSIEIVQPVLGPIIDKEMALYNKISRRNHLLYGAATYTPVISSDMDRESFEEIVGAGLGSWILLRQDDKASILDTPTAALQDMDRAIENSIEEMAKLGIRMLTPETDQSGIALQIRNAAQTAQLGSLNNKVSNTVKQVIAFLINWRLNTDLRPEDIDFSLSADFNPSPLGEEWLRLATEWYQQGLIARSDWLTLLKQNDMLPPDYNDEEAQMEISEGMEQAMAFQMQMNEQFADDVEEEENPNAQKDGEGS